MLIRRHPDQFLYGHESSDSASDGAGGSYPTFKIEVDKLPLYN